MTIIPFHQKCIWPELIRPCRACYFKDGPPELPLKFIKSLDFWDTFVVFGSLVRCILLLQGGGDGGDVNPDTNSTGGYAGQKAWLYYYY